MEKAFEVTKLDELKNTRKLLSNIFALLYQFTKVTGREAASLAEALSFIDEMNKKVQADIVILEPVLENKISPVLEVVSPDAPSVATTTPNEVPAGA